MEYKFCTYSNHSVSLTLFSKGIRYKDGYQPWCKDCQRLERQANKAVYTARRSKYYQENKEYLDQQNREWVKRNPEASAAIKRKWIDANYEKRLEVSLKSFKKNYDKNRLKIYENVKRRRARKKGAYGTVTAAEWEAKQKEYNFCCAYCGKPKKLTQDHQLPLSRGGTHTIDNIVPACINCNSRKRTKTPQEFQIK